MVNEHLEKTPADDICDRVLSQLVQEARKHPLQSSQRQLALNRLSEKILRSGRLGHPQRGSWQPNLYEDIYNEALQKTLLKICQTIDNYHPERPVLAWVNFHLNKQFIEVVKDYYKKGITSIPKSEKKQLTTSVLSLDDLDRYIPEEDTITDAELLRQFIENDPENFLKTEQIQDRPQVTFQLLAHAKFVEDKTWSEIATSLEVPVQTLYSFFYRRLQKFMPYFRKYLQE
jgi:DNA-directed RNA polymerase specialized sigma24 family protein